MNIEQLLEALSKCGDIEEDALLAEVVQPLLDQAREEQPSADWERELYEI